MQSVFILLAGITVAAAIGAMCLRNLVHCALCLVFTFLGLAAVYLQLQAQFAGLVQILVYVGAVAILIVFAVLLTRSSDVAPGKRVFNSSWWAGLLVAGAGLLVFVVSIMGSGARDKFPEESASLPVKTIGISLLDTYLVPLEVMGLLLTVALIGAVLIALPEKES